MLLDPDSCIIGNELFKRSNERTLELTQVMNEEMTTALDTLTGRTLDRTYLEIRGCYLTRGFSV